MRLILKVSVAIIIATVALLAWAPWATNDFATGRVVEKLGGPEGHFYYLTQDMAIKDIPKEVSWLPFGRWVTFPGEAGWFVSFYGNVWP